MHNQIISDKSRISSKSALKEKSEVSVSPVKKKPRIADIPLPLQTIVKVLTIAHYKIENFLVQHLEKVPEHLRSLPTRSK